MENIKTGEKEMREIGKREGDAEPGGGTCHSPEGAGVLVMVVMVTVGQTQETAGGDDVTSAK